MVISPPLSEGPSADICLSAVTCYLWQGRWGQNTTIDPVTIDGPNGIDDEGGSRLPLETQCTAGKLPQSSSPKGSKRRVSPCSFVCRVVAEVGEEPEQVPVFKREVGGEYQAPFVYLYICFRGHRDAHNMNAPLGYLHKQQRRNYHSPYD